MYFILRIGCRKEDNRVAHNVVHDEIREVFLSYSVFILKTLLKTTEEN